MERGGNLVQGERLAKVRSWYSRVGGGFGECCCCENVYIYVRECMCGKFKQERGMRGESERCMSEAVRLIPHYREGFGEAYAKCWYYVLGHHGSSTLTHPLTHRDE